MLDRQVIDSDDVSELCDIIGGLDAWLARGGFLPERWDVNRKDPVKCFLCDGKGNIMLHGQFPNLCTVCRGSGDSSRPNVRDPRTGAWVPVL